MSRANHDPGWIVLSVDNLTPPRRDTVRWLEVQEPDAIRLAAQDLCSWRQGVPVMTSVIIDAVQKDGDIAKFCKLVEARVAQIRRRAEMKALVDLPLTNRGEA